MKIVKVDRGRPDAGVIAEAAAVIRAGGLVVLPTETVYGVAAALLDEAAIEKIYSAKGRPSHKPLPVLISDASQVRAAVRHVPRAARRLMEMFWPGPLTIVMDAAPAVPLAVTAATGTVGVRMPDDELALGLMRQAGVPLACTSANLSGDPSASGVDAIAGGFISRVDLVLDGGETPIGIPSTVVDLTGAAPRLIRAGSIAADDIEAVLGLKLAK